MAVNVRILRGRVVEECGVGVAGVQVRLGRARQNRFAPLGMATTDAEGDFQLDLLRLAGESDRGPFALRVFKGGLELEVREGGSWTLRPGDPPVAEILVGKALPRKTAEQFAGEALPPGVSVRGSVVRQAGAPVAGLKVRLNTVTTSALSEGFTVSQVGADVVLDSTGDFLFANPSLGAGYFAVKVEVRTATGDVVLATSDLVPVPDTTQVGHLLIDVYLGDLAGTAEHDRLAPTTGDTVGQRLDAVDLSTAKADALAVVHSSTMEEPSTIGRFATARRLVERLDLSDLVSTDPVYDFRERAVYALLAKGLPPSPARLVEQPEERVREAIEEALDENLVSVSGVVGYDPGDFPDDVVAALKKARWERSDDVSVPGALINLISAIKGPYGLTGAERDTVRTAMDTSGGDAATFWSSLAPLGLSATKRDGLRCSIELGVVTLNNAAAINEILTFFDVNQATIVTLPDLAELSDANWQTIVAPLDEDDLAGVQGPDVEGKQANFITLVKQQVERAHPSAVLHKAIRDDGGALPDTKTYLTNNPGFDFRADYIADGAASEAVVADLRAYQRLFRVMPEVGRHAALQVLKAGGVTSAVEIDRMGYPRFVETYGPQLDADPEVGAEIAKTIYRKARAQAGRALGLLATHHPGLQGPRIAMIPPLDTTDADQIPGYTELFGGMSYCQCAECQSVLGPAAYFADVLTWLGVRGVLGTSPYALNGRRADVCTLLLDCANTKVLVPYIDLVNELLEYAVDDTVPLPTTTTGTSDERRVTPQYRGDAYGELQTAIHPKTLPFHLPLTEMRAFLGPIGTTRIALMRAVTRSGVPSAANLAAEQLGLPPTGAAIIDSDATPSPWERWGYAVEGTWTTDLGAVPEFLARAGITHPQLLDLLHTTYAGQVVGMNRKYVVDGDPCNVDDQVIVDIDAVPVVGPDAAAWTRMDRFLRLWRATGRSMLTLDKVIEAVASGEDLDGRLAEIAEIHRVATDTGLRPTVLLSWWQSRIDTLLDRDGAEAPEKCLYDEVFLDDSLPGSATAFALNSDRNELFATSTFTAQRKRLEAALAVTPEGFEAIRNAVNPPADVLNLSTLTQAYRRASLSRHLGLVPADLERLLAISPFDPFNPNDFGTDSVPFLRDARRLRDSGFSLDEALYLTTHESGAAGRLAPSEEELRVLLGRLRDHLNEARRSDPDGTGGGLFEEVLPRHVAEGFGLDEDVARGLATTQFANVGAATLASTFGVDAFIDYPTGADPWSDLNPTNFAAAFHLAEILLKIRLLVSRLGASAEEVDAWRTSLAQGSGLLPFASLRWEASGSAPTLAEFLDTVDAFRAREVLLGDGPWSDVLAALGGTAGAVAAPLTARTTWPTQDFTTWLTAFGTTAAGLVQTAKAMRLTRLAGVPASTLDGWATATPTSADDVVAAARGRYPDFATWAAVVTPIRDGLRTAQRDALVAYLVGTSYQGATSADDLYGWFLLDVEMSPCAATSRLRQAISSVQTLVQRGLLGLETGITFDERDAAEWEWMKTYRVWEAARKVFLWPENWFDPQLRRDKTPFFEDLEQALLQEEITDESVETAMVGYLERLNEVARLVPVGTYHEKDDEVDTLHVVARTRTTPHKHFYRRRENGAAWTPWEEIDAEIGSGHVILVVHNRRLMVFWPSFEAVEETTINTTNVEVTTLLTVPLNTGTTTTVYQDIALSWTSRSRTGTWAPLATGTAKLETKGIWWTGDAPPESYRFVVDAGTDDLSIHVIQGAKDQGGGTRRVWSRWVARFVFDDVSLDVRVSTAAPSLALAQPNANEIPGQTDGWYQGWILEEGATHFAVLAPTQAFANAGPYQEAVLLQARGDLALAVPPDQYMPFVSQDTLVVGGARRAFVVEPVPIGAKTGQSVKDANPWRPGLNPDLSGALYSPARDTLTVPARTLRTGRYSEKGDADEAIDQAWLQLQAANANERDSYTATGSDVEFAFTPFYHPFSEDFLREVHRHGVMALLAPDPDGTGADLIRQALTHDVFQSTYAPTRFTTRPYPVEAIDFDILGACSAYNWEIFFHAPLTIAEELRKNQRFDEAMRWYQTLFDPRRVTASDATAVWRIKPLAEPPDQPIVDLGQWTGVGPETPDERARARAYEALLDRWRQDPFDPDLVARLRPGAFHRVVVLRYIQNLVEWGDHLFRQFTMETVNEATQLYVLASKILGDRPIELGHANYQLVPAYQSFNELAADPGSLSWGLVGLEQLLSEPQDDAPSGPVGPPLPYISTYFCVPPNESLLDLWDLVADRLFKIRHCQTIEGEFRPLPLFEPPIDPGLLVRAAAEGVSLSTVMGTVPPQFPNHRFAFVHQRAMALAGSVQRLGGALLAALEKRDAEKLGLIRSGQELALLQQIRALKVDQVDEAKASRAALEKARKAVQQRRTYYDALLAVGNIREEEAQLANLQNSRVSALYAEGLLLAAGVVRLIPEFTGGTIGIFPTALVQSGGGSGAGAMGLAADAHRAVSAFLSSLSTSQGIKASYERRAQEWQQQLDQATTEVEGLDKQLEAARLRQSIAEKDLANHDRQVANAREVDRFLRAKFTSEQLYSWMVGQISGLYFQAYQLAFDTARQAELCFAHEVALDPSAVSFVRFGAWDSLKKGLLAGERLQADLERMEAEYAKEDRREFELTKNVSLDLLDPMALVQLREQGACEFWVPEVWLDLDYPGHFFRRLQAVTVSVPSVSGPIAGLTAELEMVDNKLRYKETTTDYDAQSSAEVRSVGGALSGAPTVIATSTGADDGGLFSVDWRDPKYLPFERHGAISRWKLRLTGSADLGTRPTFDWQSIADVVLTLRYTARAAPDLKTPAVDATTASLNGYGSLSDSSTGLKRVFRASVDFPDAWHAFLNPEGSPTNTTLVLPVTLDHFPFPFRDTGTVVERVELFMQADASETLLVGGVTVGEENVEGDVIGTPLKFGLAHLTLPDFTTAPAPDTVLIQAATADVAAVAGLKDLIVVLHYTVA